MVATLTDPRSIPRLPVLGWETFCGPSTTSVPSLLDAESILMTTSGRASIALALEALGVSTGDRVLMPTYHCPTMVAPLKHRGGVPVFYGLDEGGHPNLESISRDTLRGVKAILVAHYFGIPQPMAGIRALCDEYGIPLIEDCAHALFGVSDGRPVGRWGDLAIGSLTKFLPVPEGGVLISATRRLEGLHLDSCGPIKQFASLADAIELGARHRRFPGLNLPLIGLFTLKQALRGASDNSEASNVEEVDAPSHTWDGFTIDTALSHMRLTASTRWIVHTSPRQRITRRRREHYAYLSERLIGHSGFEPLFPELPPNAVPYVFPLRVGDPQPKYRRLRREGVPVFRWDRLWPDTPHLEGDHGLEWSRSVFQFPCHQDLGRADLDLIVDKIHSICA